MSAESALRPEAPRFDTTLGAWVLSRYQDIVAAFREPRLWPVSAKSEPASETYDETAQEQVRAETLAAFPPAALAQWRERMEIRAREIAACLPTERPVDLIREFARPWCLTAAVVVTGVDPCDSERLGQLAGHVSAAAADPYDSILGSRAREVKAELDRAFQMQPTPLRSSTFVALSHTVACLLANSWVALAEWPEEYARLRAQNDLLPKATEEFIRYAGIPRSLSRRATANVEIGGVTITQGAQVVLMVAAANRDPAQFFDPNRLDVARPAGGHLAFGTGPHSCVGSTLIRMALTVATGALIGTFQSMELAGLVVWRGGEGFRTPEALTVVLKREVQS